MFIRASFFLEGIVVGRGGWSGVGKYDHSVCDSLQTPAPHSPLDHGPQLKCSEFVLRLSDFFLGGLLFIKSAFFGCVLYARECTKYISLFSQTL